jgi:hypothetical protein
MLAAGSRVVMIDRPLDPKAGRQCPLNVDVMRPLRVDRVIIVYAEHRRLGVADTNSSENFADKVVSLRRRYTFGDEVRIN